VSRRAGRIGNGFWVMPITTLYAALLTPLFVFLSVRVIAMRRVQAPLWVTGAIFSSSIACGYRPHAALACLYGAVSQPLNYAAPFGLRLALRRVPL
jgi:hypothetical protein